MVETQLTVGDLADEVRSKNAGPFWITLDIFLADDADYQHLIESDVITPEQISALYRVPPEQVQIFPLPLLHAIKISFPRAVTAGSFEDRDQHAGQQHIPLVRLVMPPQPPDKDEADYGRVATSTTRSVVSGDQADQMEWPPGSRPPSE